LIYVIGLCGVLHFMWGVKSGNKIAVTEPLIYLAILIVLLAFRVPSWLRLLDAARARRDKVPDTPTRAPASS
jgi:DMSO/TMAO reductase YedYZ heme-binding membrane subunit